MDRPRWTHNACREMSCPGPRKEETRAWSWRSRPGGQQHTRNKGQTEAAPNERTGVGHVREVARRTHFRKGFEKKMKQEPINREFHEVQRVNILIPTQVNTF